MLQKIFLVLDNILTVPILASVIHLNTLSCDMTNENSEPLRSLSALFFREQDYNFFVSKYF